MVDIYIYFVSLVESSLLKFTAKVQQYLFVLLT